MSPKWPSVYASDTGFLGRQSEPLSAPNGFLRNSFAYDVPSPLSDQHDPTTCNSLEFRMVSRKRPKYTRSKTGCLSCRSKKVKCDEAKPRCQRCLNSQRECIWPEPRHPQRYTSCSSPEDSAKGGSPISGPSSIQSIHPDLGALACRTTSSAQTCDTNFGLASSSGPQQSRASSLMPPFVSPPTIHAPRVSSTLPMKHDPGHGWTPDDTFDYSPHVDAVSPFISSHSVAGRNQRPFPLLYSPDVLAPYYNNEQERHLMLHFTRYASKIILSIPEIDPISSTQVMLAMSQPPGTDPLVDALRTAVLGISATHQAFLLSCSGIATSTDSNKLLRGVPSTTTTAQQLAQAYRRESKRLLAGACTNATSACSDIALIVVQAISLMDIFGGGSSEHWSRNIALGKALMKLRGGPSIVLQQAPLQSRVQTNMFMELLAVYDTVGCLATGEQPELLAEGVRSWWDQGLVSHFEHIFGFSKDLMPLVADLAQLLSHIGSSDNRILEVIEGQEAADPNTAAGHGLMERLGRWSASHGPVHERVDVGNEIYQRTIQISLLLEVFKHPYSHPLVQDHARSIIILTAKATNAGLGVILIWPVLIAGSAIATSQRHLVIAILAKFRTQCCFEVDIAQNIIFKVWERYDRREPGANWRSVVKDHNWTFLIL